jgi:DNA-binding CsgD family transcriptional regulator
MSGSSLDPPRPGLAAAVRLPPPDWRALALEVVEIGAAAASLQGSVTELMGLLQRHVGFDTAALSPLSSGWSLTWNKPARFEALWRERSAIYIAEVASLVRVALGEAAVAYDVEALTARERDRSRFYDEYFRPQGGGSLICVGLTVPGAEAALALTRHGRARFRAAELGLLRRLRPALTLAVRGLSGPAPEPQPAPALLAVTPREREISEYVARGLTNGEIAALCGCSPNTVRNRLARVFQKLEVSTRAELAALIASRQR